jgi:hypothetical protein
MVFMDVVSRDVDLPHRAGRAMDARSEGRRKPCAGARGRVPIGPRSRRIEILPAPCFFLSRTMPRASMEHRSLSQKRFPLGPRLSSIGPKNEPIFRMGSDALFNLEHRWTLENRGHFSEAML